MFSPDGEYPDLCLHGLMATVAQNDPSVREALVELRELRGSLLRDLSESVNLDELSMGTSGDYHEAIARGMITMRVGRIIFGGYLYQKQRLRNRGNLTAMSSDVSSYPRRRFLPGIIATAAGALVATCASKSKVERVDAIDTPVGDGVVIDSYIVTQPEEDKFAIFPSPCPHQNGRIPEVSNGVMTCPDHNSRFDITTGEIVADPSRRPAGQAPLLAEGTKLIVSQK